MIDVVMGFQGTTEMEGEPLMSASFAVASAPRRAVRWGLVLRVMAGLTAVCLVAGWTGHKLVQRQRNSLKLMREAVEGSLAPGEVVVVDDRLLAWALRRGSDGVLRQSVWTVSEDVPMASLLAQMAETNRREIVVVARPDDRLIQHMDEAGFSVAQEVGWVPWDLKGNGRALLGRGRMRVFFAVAPKTADAVKDAGAVSSGAESK